jgi:hypothetical protein
MGTPRTAPAHHALTALLLSTVTVVALAGCGADEGGASADAAVDDADPSTPDGALPVCDQCPDEANADAYCPLEECDYFCEDGFARCGAEDACVAESAQACGQQCAACPTGDDGTPACRNGACILECDPGYVECAPGACCLNTQRSLAPQWRGGSSPRFIMDGGAYHGTFQLGNQIYYASDASGRWRQELVANLDTTLTHQHELVMGTRGPVIGMINRDSELIVAEGRTGGWAAHVLAEAPSTFDIATDEFGRIHVCYDLDSGAGLFYAYRRGDGAWQTEEVLDSSEACALTTHDGHVYLAYGSPLADLVLLEKPYAGTFAAPKTIGSGLPHALLVSSDAIDVVVEDQDHLHYRSADRGKTWATSTITTAGTLFFMESTLARTVDGELFVAYWNTDASEARLARFDGAAWEFAQVLGEASAFLFLDDQGRLGASADDGDLAFWRTRGGALAREQVYPDAFVAADAIDVAQDAAGAPVAFWRQDAASLVFSRFDGDAWDEAPLGITGRDPQLAISGAAIHTAYERTTDSAIMYGVGKVTDLGGHAVAIADSTRLWDLAVVGEVPHVLYTDGAGQLRHAAKDGAQWPSTVVDAGTPVRAKLVVHDDEVHVVWNAASAVKHARIGDPTVATVLDEAAGYLDAIATPAGELHVCIAEGTSSDPRLWVAHKARGQAWTADEVAPIGADEWERGCGVGVDGAGALAVTTSRSSANGARDTALLRNPGGRWEATTLDPFFSFSEGGRILARGGATHVLLWGTTVSVSGSVVANHYELD